MLTRLVLILALGLLLGCDDPVRVTRRVEAAELTGVWLSLNEDNGFQVVKAMVTRRHPQDFRLALFDNQSCLAGGTVVRHAMACMRVGSPERSVVGCSWSHGAWPGGHGVTIRFDVPNGQERYTDVPLWVMSDSGGMSLSRGCEGSNESYFMLTRP